MLHHLFMDMQDKGTDAFRQIKDLEEKIKVTEAEIQKSKKFGFQATPEDQQKLEELKKAKEQESKKVVVKKFIIKERRRKQPTPSSDVETQPESNVFTETDGTDHELYKKLKRKERVMKKLNELQELAKPKQQPVQSQVKPRYSLFY